ncbi:hypothetical protein [Nonomuraea turcica]|uniref:hypothetical protein n=1 Tax=Nonomuraea sp. G32 TaxID=3067274 RepID=UPI00273B14C4|nr:hypothetical protein [Nonomuraea sp. G32]MDP4509725.1 hypothetical protein [Nonomuraea sp. G32]
MSEFSGVKQPEFDTMTSKHAQTASRLEELAQALHRELKSAGLDTAPATRLRQLAGRVTTQAADLRRRQRLVHELQRQKVTFGRSTPKGSFLEVPDNLEAAQGLLDGTLAGRAALKAADGDRKALAELQKYASRTGDPEFVKSFLRTLGALGVTRVPGAIAMQLRDAKKRQDAEGVTQLSRQGQKVLGMLSTALAKGTDPRSPAYVGADFLKGLVKEGRAEHKAGDTKYSGYQAQALIWRAHDGKPPFSKEFMEVVGRDVIVYEHEQRKDQWAAAKDPLGRYVKGKQLPIIDLAGAFGLGTLLRPGTQAGSPGMESQSAVVDNLFHAAKSSREASQALLNHTPAGWKESVLDYLITTRWSASRFLNDYKPIRDMLTIATTGQDATSKKLAAEMIKTLSDQISGAFSKDTENLEIKNRYLFDRYAPLGYPLGRAIAANIEQLSELLLNHAAFGKVEAKDMAYALVLATADDAAFEGLVRAQTEHMKAALESVPPVGLNVSNAERLGFTKSDVKQHDRNGDGRVDMDDIQHFLVDRTAAEARPFGFIVETRRQVLIAQGLDDRKANEALKSMVGSALGLLPVPGAKQVTELAKGAFGELLGKGYDKFAGAAYDEIARQAAQRMFEHGRTMDETHAALANDRLAVERLGEQMLTTAMLNKGMLDDLNPRKQTFVTGTPPRLKPFAQMTPQEYSQFLKWARAEGGMNDLLDRFSGTFRRTSEIHDYLDLKVPSSTEGGK